MPYTLIVPLSIALGFATSAIFFRDSGPLIAFGLAFAFLWVAPLTFGYAYLCGQNGRPGE